MDNSSHKLLVIDDQIGVRQSLVTYLEDSGFMVYDAPDASTGLELFKETLPDLVITDLSMPNVSGLTLIQQIHDIVPDSPVIVISGAGVMSDVVEALRLGATDFFIKPIVDMEVLVHSINKSLERTSLMVENQLYRLELEKANDQLKQNIHALEQDQLAGHFVQQCMLPASPFYAKNFSCEQKVIPSLYLSGDCVDYAFLKQRYYAFYLADVSGHGSAPAFVTIWLKNLVAQLVRLKQLENQFDTPGHALLELLNIINAEMMEIDLNNHLTCIFGIIDTEKNTLSYVVAGHLPLPVMLSGGKAEFLEGSGKPIGLYANAEWNVYERQLPEDDCSLILFSDGILEILQPEKLMEKEQALLQLVEKSNANISDLIKHLALDSIEQLPDDIAMLSIDKSPA